jgi:hypothetical protein
MGWLEHWSMADTAQLIALHKEGHSFGSIAITMRKTRNSIAGKLGRLGRLKTRDPRSYQWHYCVQPRVRNPRCRWPRKPRGRPRVFTLPLNTPEPIGCPDWLGLTIFELTNKTCRWPSGQGPYFFCGAPQADLEERRPYCPYHDRIAHTYSRAT